MQLGGNWCGWCSTLTKYFHENKVVRGELLKSYLIMKMNISDKNRNGRRGNT